MSVGADRSLDRDHCTTFPKTQNATGKPAYDALMMFKILLLQTWYGLSDYEVEERINVATGTKITC